MKIFVIGASGLVGSYCLKHFREKGWSVVGSHYAYATGATCYYNPLQPDEKENFDIASFKPDVIVHCAALTHVDYCETHEQESFDHTVKTTQHVCQLATVCGSRIVYISTDYVFDGVTGPYKESDSPNPVNVYGKHKLHAEKVVLTSPLKSLVLRVTNVYGDEVRQKNFAARIIQQCQQKQEICLKLPYDQYATPTYAYDIARAIFCLIEDKKDGIYHLASTDYMNRVELALKIIARFPDVHSNAIEAVNSAALQQNARRPLIGGLLKVKFAAEYPMFVFYSIDDYLTSITKSANPQSEIKHDDDSIPNRTQ